MWLQWSQESRAVDTEGRESLFRDEGITSEDGEKVSRVLQ